MNESQRQLFDYLQENNLYDGDTTSFSEGLQDTAKTRELYQWLKENNYTDEEETDFINKLTVPAQQPSAILSQAEIIQGNEQLGQYDQPQLIPPPELIDASPTGILRKSMAGEDTGKIISDLASGTAVEDKSLESFNQIASETESVLKRYYNTDDVQVILGDSGMRSMEDQAAYLKSGASRTSLSLHNYGEAADYQIFINGKSVDATQKSKALEHSVEPYQILGGIAKQHGFFWGYPHDSGHVASFRYVDQLIKDRPELANSKQTTEFYEKYRETAPKILEPLLTTLDGLYGQESQRTYTGKDRIDDPLLHPINPYPEQEQEQAERVGEAPQVADVNYMDEFGGIEGFAPPDVTSSTTMFSGVQDPGAPAHIEPTPLPQHVGYVTGSTTKPYVPTFDPGYGEAVKWVVDGALTDMLGLDPAGGWMHTKEFDPFTRDLATLSKNIISHVAEAPFLMMFDLPQAASKDPIGTVNGLFHFMKDEGEFLLASINLHPKQTYFNYKGDYASAKKMRDEAIQHIFDNGGVYTYFMAAGLAHAGTHIKNKSRLASDAVDVMEMVHDRPPIGEITEQKIKAAETIKNNPELRARMQNVVDQQLTLDFMDPAKADRVIASAEKVATDATIKTMRKKPTKGAKKPKEVKPDPVEPSQLEQVVSIDRWWDNSKKNHVITKRDANGNQIGKVEYEVSKADALAKVSEMEAAHGIVKKKGKKPKAPVEAKPEVVERVKLEKSSDLNVGKNIEPIKGETARRFKSRDKLDSHIENKLSEYIGQNVIARWGETSKGDFVVKIFKKTKEQPLPSTATKRPPLRIKTDAQEIVSTMRDPRSRGIVDRKILVEKYTEEVSELRRGREITESQLVDLKLKQEIYKKDLDNFKRREEHYSNQAQKHAKNGDVKKAEIADRKATAEGMKARQYVQEHGVGLENRIKVMESSIDSYNSSLGKSKSQLRLEMSNIELVKDTVKKISRINSLGAVGKNIKKKLSKEQIELRLEVAENIKEIWNRTHTGVAMTAKGLRNALKAEGWDKKSIAYAVKNIGEISADTQIQSAKSLARKLDAEASQTSGKVRDTETKTRSSDEYSANINLETVAGENPSPMNQAKADLLISIVDNIGGEGIETARGTRTIPEIRRGGSDKRMMASVAEELMSGKFRVDKLAERVEGTRQLWNSLIEEWAKNPESLVNRDMTIEATKMLVHYYSEIPRAFRYFRDLSSADARNYFEKMVERGELGELHGDVVLAMRALLEGTEVKRHWLHKVAEYARNAKLATLSSVVRSTAGNSIGVLDATVRMPFEIGFDYLIGQSSAAIHNISGGKIGNLNGSQMSMLEIGAAWKGFRLGMPEGGKLAWQMLLENDKALKESSFYYRESLHNKEISGKKGVVIRTPQRVQGAVDIMGRVPLTSAYMHRFAVRQAIKEGHKTNPEILSRAQEILSLEELSPEMIKLARESGEYATFQRELGVIGKWVNAQRVGPGLGPAAAQIVVPFFNTATNLLKWSLEHSPLEFATPTFGRAFRDAYSASGSGSSPLAVQMGKLTTGAITMWMLAEYFGLEQEGKIMGDWSELRPEERDLLTQQGKQEYSIENRDGSIVSYRGFEPLSTYLVLADRYQRTDILRNATKGDYEKAGEELYGVTKAFVQSFLENPFVMGVGNIAKVFDRRDDVVHYFVNLAAGAAMPGGLRQMRGILDKTRRKRYTMTDVLNQEVTFSDMFMSQVYQTAPWLTDKNMPALDPFGRVIKNADPVGALYAWRKTQNAPDPVYQEVQRLYFDQGKGFAPATPWFSKDELAKLKLSKEEHYRLIQYSGDWLYNVVNGLIQWEEWNKPTPVEAAASMLAKNKTEYRDLLAKGDEIFVERNQNGELILNDAQMREIRKGSMTDYGRRKIINRVRERAFHAFRTTLYLPEYSGIEEEMGRLESVDYFKNEEQRQAYRNERRQHYGLDEIGDKEYWERIERLVARIKTTYYPKSASPVGKITMEAYEGLEQMNVPR